MHTTPLVSNKIKKKAYFTMALLIAGSNILLVGCVSKKPYRGFLMVEKPPIRIIVIDADKDIDSDLVDSVTDMAMLVPYKRTQFNPTTEIGVHTDYKHDFSDVIERKIDAKLKVKN